MDRKSFREAIASELEGNLLPFWRNRSLDRVHGGFISEMANDGTVRGDSPRGLILNSRLLWAFAALYRQLGDERDLERLRGDVVRIALDHHLVSAYTSLVAVDVTPVRRGHETLASHAVEPDLPAGWSDDDAFGMARGATAADLRIALGLLLVACGGLLRRLRAAS